MLRSTLPYVLWPVSVAGSAALLIVGYQRDLFVPALVALPTLLMVTFYALEHVMPAVPGESAHEDPQLGNDVGHILLGATVGEALANQLMRVGVAGLAALLPAALDLWPHHWPMAAQVTLLLLTAETLEYWRHRLGHRVPLLWRAHELHHSGDHLNVLKSPRNHVIELMLRALMVYTPLVLLGAPATWIPFYAGAVMVLGPIAHANLDLRLPGFVHYLIGTPQLHAIHHASEARFADRNFSNLPLLDLLFGTFVHPEGHGRPAAGVAGPAPPQDFVRQLLAPFRPRPDTSTQLAGNAHVTP